MADITYTPKYVAPFYRDNVDLVSAEGPIGFNFQFSALKAEFDQLVQVVSQLNTAIKAAGQRPSVQLSISLAPTMITVIPPPPAITAGWAQHAGFVDKPSTLPNGQPQTTALGVMPVNLPDKVTIVSMRVTGHNAGPGNLRVVLQRQPIIADNSQPDSIVTVTCAGDPFDTSVPPPALDQNLVVVHNDLFKYFIVALVVGAQATDVVQLNAFQITYQTPAQ